LRALWYRLLLATLYRRRDGWLLVLVSYLTKVPKTQMEARVKRRPQNRVASLAASSVRWLIGRNGRLTHSAIKRIFENQNSPISRTYSRASCTFAARNRDYPIAHAREMHAHEMHTCEMHVYEVHTYEIVKLRSRVLIAGRACD